MENEYLKEQLTRAAGGLPPLMVDYVNNKSATPKELSIQQHQVEVNALREENLKLREDRETAEKYFHKLMLENQNLYVKLENLESNFVGAGVKEEGKNRISQDHTTNSLLNENANLKKRLNLLQMENSEINAKFGEAALVSNEDIKLLQNMHGELLMKVEGLQKRERELLEMLVKAQKNKYK
jgi:hypothetical protein